MDNLKFENLKKEVDELIGNNLSGVAIQRLNEFVNSNTDFYPGLEYYADMLVLIGLLEDASLMYKNAFILSKKEDRLIWKRMGVMLMMGQWEEQETLIKEITNPDINSSEKDLFEITRLNKSGSYRDCLEKLERSSLQNFFPWQYFHFKANSLYCLYRSEEWIDFVTNTRIVDDTNPWFKCAYADMNSKTDSMKMAELLIDQVNQGFLHFPQGQLEKAELCWKRDDVDEAEQWFNKALEEAPWSDAAVGMHAVFNASEKRGKIKWDQLIDLAAKPGYPKLAYYLGKIKMGVEKDPVAAIPLFQKTKNALPDFIDTRRLLGDACLQSGNFAAALTEFEAANDITAGIPAILNGIAFASLQLNDHAKAKQFYQLLLQADETHAEAMHALSLIAYEEKDLVTAMSYIKKAIAINKKEPRYFFMAAKIEAAGGSKEQALRCTNDALKYDPGNEEYLSFKRSLE